MRKYLIFLLIFLSVSLSFAQESTETPAAPSEEAAIPTEVITEAPTQETVIPTEIITEAATEAITEEPTADFTEVLEATVELPTAEPTTVNAPSPEPALSLWASDSFERQISPHWVLPLGWTSTESNLSIESANSAYFSNESFSEVAVQGQFRLAAASTVSVFVRNGYRASLNSEGRLSIWRDDVELATTTVVLNPDGHFLRLSAFGDTLRLSLDGQALLIAQDTSYSAGQIGVRVDFNETGLVTLDNFGVWIPTDMLPSVPATTVPVAQGNVQALLPPNLTAPALNGIVSKLRPTFSWQARTGAVQYRLRIASNFSCSTVISGGEILTSTNSYTPNFDIPQGEYWYCVEALDNMAAWSGFGEKRRFVINLSLTPANLAVNTTNMTTNFTWTAVAGATYDLQIADDSSFSLPTVINGLTTNSYSHLNSGYGQYYWRVHVNGSELPMSLARSYYISPPLPLASNNALPLNNGKYTNNVNPTLNWTVPSNWQAPQPGQSITYELHLASDSAFQFMVAPAVTGIGTNNYQWTATNLADGRYYWRLRARTNLGLYGPWSATFNFYVDTQAPSMVEQLAPNSGVTLSTARPTLSWSSVADASRYLVEVAKNSDFDNEIVVSVTVSTRTYTLTTSLTQGMHAWRVWAIDAAGNMSLAATGRLIHIYYPTSPRQEQVFVSEIPRTVTFRWALVPGTTGAIYTVEVDDDISFGSIDYTSPARSTASWTSPQLAQGRWYWRLNVVGYGTSEPFGFFISPALPNAPVLTSPANNSVTNDESPTFQWNEPTMNEDSVQAYHIQFSTNSNFTVPVGGIPIIVGTSFTLTPDFTLIDGTTYYWRVRAVTNMGAVGPWSSAKYFKLDMTAPLAPNPISPINGASVTNPLPQLKLAASAGANRYEVRYGLVSDLSAVTPILVTTLYYNVPSPLLLDTYYWQVRALDAAGNVGAWSAVQDFDVDSPPTAVSSPWLFTTDTPTLSWTPLYWAGQYEIQVSTSSNFSGSPVFTATVNSSTLSVTTTTLSEGFYYFRVRGISQPEAAGGVGSWSATETFTIDVP